MCVYVGDHGRQGLGRGHHAVQRAGRQDGGTYNIYHS